VREFSVPPVVTVDDRATLTDPVWQNAETVPDYRQFIRGRSEHREEVSSAQFRDEVIALARGLIAAGVAAGDRVGLMSRTRYEWTLVDYAIWSCGAVTVPIYETSSADQVAWILSDSGAVACFTETERHYRTVTEVRDQLPALEHVWQIAPASATESADNTRAGESPVPAAPPRGAIEELVADGAAIPSEEIEQRRSASCADDLATIIYTSGTTGRPKGCVLTHRNMYFDVANAVPGLSSLFHEGASTLLFLPLAHAFARLIQLGAVHARATLAHSADIRTLTDDLQDLQPTFILSVPRAFEKLHNTARQRAHADGKGAIFDRAERVAIAYSEALDTSSGPGLGLRLQHALFERLVYTKLRAALGGRCRQAISGGAPLGERLAHYFRGIGITIFEGYGLTETSPASTTNTSEHLRIGTVGRPLPGVTIRVAEDGEILIKGPHVFQRYWNNDAATAEVIDRDGWFHSGDIGELDDDGYLRITGRKKELIVTATGKNVSPAVLEDRLRAHPLVSQCVVVGDRRPFVAALVAIDPDALRDWAQAHGKPNSADAAALRDDADLRSAVQQAVDDANLAVSRAEEIRAFRILPRDFSEEGGELTPSMKVKRDVVVKEYADEIDAIYRR
jgi:long-chain acyl-CoA synthetase